MGKPCWLLRRGWGGRSGQKEDKKAGEQVGEAEEAGSAGHSAPRGEEGAGTQPPVPSFRMETRKLLPNPAVR